MRIYNTEQRKLLLSFFEKYPDRNFTAKEIYEKTGGDISLSAVYRNLSELSSSGMITKNAGEKREALYRFSGASECKNRLHLCCSVCKKTVHIDNKTAEKIKTALYDGGFGLNISDTVLYGVCPDCKNNGGNYGTAQM